MRTIISALGALFVVGSASAALADYPSRAINLVVPHSAGSPADSTARLLGNVLEEAFGQPVIIENKPGAGGTMGAAEVSKARPDGQTLLFATSSAIVVSPAIYSDLPYDPVAELAPIVGMETTGLTIQIHESVPADNVQELIEYARANPGVLSFGSAGVGTTPHFAGELFMNRTDTEMVHIPYKGSQAAIVDLLAGNIQVLFDPTSTSATTAESGRVKVLAVLTEQRSPDLPDVPTAAEAGVPEIAFAPGWFGVFAPAGTSPEILSLLEKTIVEGLETEASRASLRTFGISGGLIVGADFEERVAEGIELYRELAELAGIEKQ